MKICIYNSSAGSGKTYTLTKEYLKLCLKNDKDYSTFKHILAVTFTNKAAKEMKERVIEDLQSFGDNPEHPKLIQVSNELKIDSVTIQDRSKKVLSEILHNYSDFSIFTIDKFFHKIIRTFAVELGLHTGFTPEVNSDNYIEQTIYSLLTQIGDDNDITKITTETALQKLYNTDKRWEIKSDIQTLCKTLQNDSDIVYIKKLENTTLTDLEDTRKKIQDYLEEAKEKALALKNVIKQQGIKRESFSRELLPNYLNKIISKEFECPSETLQKYSNGERSWYAKKTTHDQQSLIEGIHNKLSDFINYMTKNIQKIKAYKKSLDIIYSSLLLPKVSNLLEKLKKEDNIVFISDFNKLINEQIKKLPVPFIYERVGEKYTHYFIDEFQDTSTMQWENFKPLVENTLSQGGTTTLVGDAKQSIYRWRGGDSKQFIDLCNSDKNKLKNLSQNFRSSENIIEFNNVFFKCISKFLSNKYQSAYKNIKQDTGKEGQKGIGYVKIEMLKKTGNTKPIEEYLTKTEDTIKGCLDKGYRQKDIAIIIRNNNEGKMIAEYLANKNYHIISSEALLLSANPQIRLLLNVFRCLINPNDKFHLLEILSYLEKYNEMYNCPNKDIFDLLLNDENNYNPSVTEQLSVYELTEYFIKFFGLEHDLYLQTFLNEILNFTSKKTDNLPNFVSYWDTHRKEKASVSASEDSDGIQILTIHKSKGLEFPVVITPFCDWEISTRKEKTWEEIEGIPFEISASHSTKIDDISKKILFDNINLIYVCFTRAIDQLYILSSVGQGDLKKITNVGKLIYHFLKCHDIPDIYEYGDSNTKFTSNLDNTVQTYQLKNIINNHWRNSDSLKIAFQSKILWDKNSKRNKGLIIHQILSEIILLSDIAPRIQYHYNEGTITEEEKKNIGNKINILLQDEKLSPLFSKGITILNEPEILLSNGKTVRPDRVVISPDNNATVIDYKTGKEDKSHTEQIQKYTKVLQNMGYQNVKGILVYLESNHIREIL